MRDNAIDAQNLKDLARNMRRPCEAQRLSQVAVAAQVKMSRPRSNFFAHQKQEVHLTTVARVMKALKDPGLL
jgi:hypothetical protein